jgi:hypothetical protein
VSGTDREVIGKDIEFGFDALHEQIEIAGELK